MWIARDKSGNLKFLPSRPRRMKTDLPKAEWWACEGVCNYVLIDFALFPDLKWEDEPVEVELVKKGES